MTTKAGKRPMRPLSTREKLDAIHRVHDGESKASVARDIGVPESTLRGWCKNEEKIALLSRQSSPETSDESLEPHGGEKIKKIKLDENQPFNLSMKTASTSNNSPYQLDGFEKNSGHHNVSGSPALDLKKIKEAAAAVNLSEREKNRAELARLSIELGLNRPEMFMSSTETTSSAPNNSIGLLAAQWNHLLMQQQQLKKTAQQPQPTQPLAKLPNEKLPLEESVRYWLNSSTPPHLSPNNSNSYANLPVTSTSSGMTQEQSAWLLKWYKTLLQYNQQQNPTSFNASQMVTSSSQQMSAPEKPILYHQLTKEKEKFESNDNNGDRHITNSKARAVLDTLLLNNNNNNDNHCKKEQNSQNNGIEAGVGGADGVITQNEAVCHGEKFLKWLESCSEPSVTSMQIMQFRALLSNVRTSAERKNGDFVQIRTKMKRK